MLELDERELIMTTGLGVARAQQNSSAAEEVPQIGYPEAAAEVADGIAVALLRTRCSHEKPTGIT